MLPDIDSTFFHVLCGNLIVSKGSLYVYLFELNLRNLLYVIEKFDIYATAGLGANMFLVKMALMNQFGENGCKLNKAYNIREKLFSDLSCCLVLIRWLEMLKSMKSKNGYTLCSDKLFNQWYNDIIIIIEVK